MKVTDDANYIIEHICEIFHAMYFVIDEWEKLKSAFSIVADMGKEVE